MTESEKAKTEKDCYPSLNSIKSSKTVFLAYKCISGDVPPLLRDFLHCAQMAVIIVNCPFFL